MDTNIKRRNKKMHGYCLGKEDHPQIVVVTKTPIAIDGRQHKFLASINVRGKEKQIELDLKVKKTRYDIREIYYICLKGCGI